MEKASQNYASNGQAEVEILKTIEAVGEDALGSIVKIW